MRIERTLRPVIEMLVDGDYAEVERISRGVGLSGEDLAEAVESWGRTLIRPPDGRIQGADVVPVEGASPDRWSVWLPLWTDEEGRSDRTLEVTVIESRGPTYDIEIDNLEVP